MRPCNALATATCLLLLSAFRAAPADAERIITLSPHAAEMVAAAGAADHLVGVAAFTDRPATAAALPVVGDARGLDRERVIALRPDLAVAWEGGNRPGDLDWIERRGIPLYRSSPRTLDDIPREIRELATIIGTPDTGTAEAARLERHIERLRTLRPGTTPRRYVFQLWPRPPMTFGGRSLVTRSLADCGAANVFGHVPRESFTPDPESLRGASADVELIPASLGDAAPLTAAPVRMQVDADALYRPGPEFIDALGALCDRLSAPARP